MAPARDITFCFTDIAGSTRLLRALGEEAYDRILERHRALIRQALGSAGGREVKTEGDGFFVTFDDPTDGVAFAAEAQLLLGREEWPMQLRVRMGLHRGLGRERADGDYSALAAHQAARVCAVSHGGQVVVTEEVATGTALPAGCRLIRLGRHRLRDFDGGVELLQLAGPSLLDGFPPVLATREDHGLPLPRSSLVGRDAELELLRDLLVATPLITLHGPGGVGKSRLALEAAAATAAAYPEGTVLVELSPVEDPGLVIATVAAAVGVRPEPGQSLEQTLISQLAVGRRLLILDSCERVLDGIAPLVELIARSCPGCRVLATSTEPIRVADERVVSVVPLPTPPLPGEPGYGTDPLQSDAVRLLFERAAAAGADLGDGSGAAAGLALIARRLDGIPLALELVARRVAEVGVDNVVRGLDDRFALLTNGWRTALPRHRTLEAMVEWTVALLDDDQRDMLARLATLRGRWEPVDAVEVCGYAPDKAAILYQLVDRSLLWTDGVPSARIRMPDTIRAYVERQSPPSDVQALERQKREWLLRRLGESRFWPDARIRAEIDALIPDVRPILATAGHSDDGNAVAELAGLVSPWFEARGLWGEAIGWLTAAIGGAPPGPARTNAVAYLAQQHALNGDQATATETARVVLGDEHAHDTARALAFVVATPLGAPVPDGGPDPLQEAVRLAGDPTSSLALAARSRIGLRLLIGGDPHAAAAEFEDVARIAREHGRSVLHANALVNLGGSLLRAGRLDEGEAALRECREVALDANLRSLAAACLTNLSVLALRRGDAAGAVALAEERLALSEAMGDRRGAAAALNAVASAAFALGDRTRARAANEEALELFRSLGIAEGGTTTLFNLVLLADADGDLPRAAEFAAELGRFVMPTGNSALHVLALLAAAGLGCRAGLLAGAELLGAAAALRPEVLALDPGDEVWLEERESELASTLGPERMADARDRGSTLTAPDALALAVRMADELST